MRNGRSVREKDKKKGEPIGRLGNVTKLL